MTDMPTGPALAYTTSPDTDGVQRVVLIDREPITDPRERALAKALLFHALRLLEASEPSRSTTIGGQP